MHDKAPSPAHHLLFPVTLLLAVGVYLWQVVDYWPYVNDDAYITFRYSYFTAYGRGPYFNLGQQVEGYSNPLLMLLMVPVLWIGGPGSVATAAKLLGVLAGLGGLWAAGRLTRQLAEDSPGRQHRVLLAAGAPLFLALCPSYALNSTSGLETTLYSFLLLWGIERMVAAERQGRWRGGGLLFAALALTRPEGALLFGVTWLAIAVPRAVRQPQPPWILPPRLFLDGFLVSAVFLLHLGFRYLAYDGEWLPNTYHAKAEGFAHIRPWPYMQGGVADAFLGWAGLGSGLVLALVRGLRSRWILALLVPALLGPLLLFYSGTDWMLGWRFLMHYLPVLSCAVLLGWIWLTEWIPRLPTLAFWLLLLGIGGLAGWQQDGKRRYLEDVITMREEGYRTGHHAIAEFLQSAAKPGDTVALMDIGIIGFECPDLNILDITGLTDRHVAKSPGPFLQKLYDPHYVVDQEPRYIILTVTAATDRFRPPIPPHPSTQFRFWTPIEDRLYNHPAFAANYRPARNSGSAPTSWNEALARQLGALQVYPHEHPLRYYLLAVFERVSTR